MRGKLHAQKLQIQFPARDPIMKEEDFLLEIFVEKRV
jgi:hypothetical protein